MPVLLVQAFASLALTGLIWCIQVVHYPLFAAVGKDEFIRYEADHARLITLVVGPLMLVELATTLWIAAARPAGVPAWMAWTGVILLAAIWLSTAAIQVPCHARLAAGFDPEVHARLVSSNWIRTVAWTARGVLALAMIAAAARGLAKSA
jgi:hypothetical protein